MFFNVFTIISTRVKSFQHCPEVISWHLGAAEKRHVTACIRMCYWTGCGFIAFPSSHSLSSPTLSLLPHTLSPPPHSLSSLTLSLLPHTLSPPPPSLSSLTLSLLPHTLSPPSHSLSLSLSLLGILICSKK